MAEHKPDSGESAAYDPKGEPSAVRSVRPTSSRRDPRADPDDEPSLSRVDVVTVDRGSRPQVVDAVANAALTLRRDLAKLHEQAAAVERTLEEQRRERSEAYDRIDAATARAQDAEQKLEVAETEIANIRRLHDAALEDLQNVRSQRDDLARAIDRAKEAADEIGRLRAEAETLKEAQTSAARAAATFEAELAELRAREQAGTQKLTDGEAELQSVRERLDRANAELSQSRDEAAQNKAENVRFRQEATTTAEAAAKKLSETERERTLAREEVERLEKQLVVARATEETLAVVQAELATMRIAAAEARTEITRLERDVEAARHARDVSVERATMAERETSDARKETEQRTRELEAANAASAAASARAASSDRARAGVEESVRQLRDEVTSAFARWRSVTPSTPPPNDQGSLPPPTRVLAQTAENEAVIPPAAIPEAAVTKSAFDDDEPEVVHTVTVSEPPLTKRGANASSSVAVRDDEEGASPSADNREEQEEGALPESILDDDWSVDSQPVVPSAPAPRSVPPPLPARAKQPPAVPRPEIRSIPPSMPPAVYPSLPPPAGSAPSARPPERPPSGIHILSEERDDLIELLGDAATARDASAKLLARADWLLGRPPVELLMALTHLDYDIESPVFELARAWEREPVCRALIAALRDEPESKLREHGAWLLKHLGAPTAWAALSELVSNESEAPAVRRWLLEAIERLVTNRNVGWTEVGELVGQLIRHSDASLRDGVVGVVAALERSDDKRRVLFDVLRTDDDEVVLASAVQALASILPVELDPSVSERLLGHPSTRVQRSVVDLIERSKRAAQSNGKE
jgi:hypothetical protein